MKLEGGIIHENIKYFDDWGIDGFRSKSQRG